MAEVEKNIPPETNFSWRARPKGWVDDPVTVTDSDGNVYSLTLIADSEGNVITPASDTALFDAVTTTNDLLREVAFFLKSMAEK